jgi:succinate-acetate transporter protein
MVVFASFGAFNLTTLFNVAMPLIYPSLPAPSDMANGFFYFLWGFLGFLFLTHSLIHTALITVSQMVFGSVVGLFWTNAISQWCRHGGATTAALVFQRLSGAIGLVCGCLATYLCAAQMLNDGKIVLPLEYQLFKRKQENTKDV